MVITPIGNQLDVLNLTTTTSFFYDVETIIEEMQALKATEGHGLYLSLKWQGTK